MEFKTKHLILAVWAAVLTAGAAQANVVIHDDQNILGYSDQFLGFTPFNSAFACNDRMDLGLTNCYTQCYGSQCQTTCNSEVDRVGVVSCGYDSVVVQSVRPNGQYYSNTVYRRDYEFSNGNVLRWSLLTSSSPSLLGNAPLAFLVQGASQVTDAYFDRVTQTNYYLRDGRVVPALAVDLRMQIWDQQSHQTYFIPLTVVVGQGVPAIAQQLSAQVQGSQPSYQVLNYTR